MDRVGALVWSRVSGAQVGPSCPWSGVSRDGARPAPHSLSFVFTRQPWLLASLL